MYEFYGQRGYGKTAANIEHMFNHGHDGCPKVNTGNPDVTELIHYDLVELRMRKLKIIDAEYKAEKL